MRRQDELWHWGIKGMKWGVRRYQNQDGTLTAEGKKRYQQDDHPDYTRAHEKKSVRELSDAELNAKINRLQKEKQYQSLVTEPSKIKKAIAIASTTAAALGTISTLYNNYNAVAKIGKNIVESEAIRKGMAATAVSAVMKAHGA
jgi:HD superfamily phosphodiesterase